MRITKLFALSAILLCGLRGQSEVTGSCRVGGTYPNCIGGEVVFTGANYAPQAHVKVTNSAGRVIDDGDYTTNGGVLSFTENFSFADTYSITVDDRVVMEVTTN